MSDGNHECCLTVLVESVNGRPLPEGFRVAINQAKLDEMMSTPHPLAAENESLRAQLSVVRQELAMAKVREGEMLQMLNQHGVYRFGRHESNDGPPGG